MKNLYSKIAKKFIILIFGVTSYTVYGAAIVTIQPNLTALTVGQVVLVPVKITGNLVGSMSLNFDFDRTVLLDPASAGLPFLQNIRAGFYSISNYNQPMPVAPYVTEQVNIYNNNPNGTNLSNAIIVNLVFIYGGGSTTIHIRQAPDAEPTSFIYDYLGNSMAPYTFTGNTASGPADPAQVTWNGSLSANWSTAGNWTPNTVPTSTSHVVIPSVSSPNFLPLVNEAFASPAVCYNMIIKSGASLNIAPGKAFTITGTLTNLAGKTGLVIKSNASSTGSIITSNPAPATVERYLTGSAWHLISSPVSAQDISSFVTTNIPGIIETLPPKYGLAPFDNTISNWVPYTTSTLVGAGDFESGKGYEILLKPAGGTAFFGGNLVSYQVDYGITSNTSPGSNWNLVGNPYAAPIKASHVDADDFLALNASNLDPVYTAIYIWDGSHPYKIYDLSTPAFYLSVGQGFFVKTIDGGGVASFTTAMRTHTAAPFYKNSETEWPSINLKANISGTERSTEIKFVPGTTQGMDPGYDAGMFDANGSADEVYTRIDGSEVGFGLQCLPFEQFDHSAIPVGVNTSDNSKVTFTAETIDLPAGTKLYIKDMATGSVTRIDQPGTSYTTTVAAGISAIGRFYLTTTDLTVGNNPLVEEVYTIIPLPQENKIRLIGNFAAGSQVYIYDMSGRILGTSKLASQATNEISFAPDANGIYMLKIQSGTKVINRKITWIR